VCCAGCGRSAVVLPAAVLLFYYSFGRFIVLDCVFLRQLLSTDYSGQCISVVNTGLTLLLDDICVNFK